MGPIRKFQSAQFLDTNVCRIFSHLKHGVDIRFEECTLNLLFATPWLRKMLLVCIEQSIANVYNLIFLLSCMYRIA